jgi:hypothetical protein
MTSLNLFAIRGLHIVLYMKIYSVIEAYEASGSHLLEREEISEIRALTLFRIVEK